MNSIYQEGHYIDIDTVPSVYTVGQIQFKINYYRRQELQHILANDDQARAVREANLTKTDNELLALIKNYQENLISDPTDRQI